MRVVLLSASPRRDGNSRLLACACAEGVRAAGHDATIVELNDELNGLLRDCRRCRNADGNCSIEDGYAKLIHEHVVPAEALVFATPLYWYGMAASLKNFFDRMICYVSASYPRHTEVIEGLDGKRTALLLASEESYPGVGLAVTAQLQEMSRYLGQRFVGSVHGIGNRRGEVAADPADPMTAARELGSRIFRIHHTDYTVRSERSNAVWTH